MSTVVVEDDLGQRTYVLRADPPPGASIVNTDRGEEWELVRALLADGTVPVVPALWFDETAVTGSQAIVWERHGGRTLHSIALGAEQSQHLGLALPFGDLCAQIHRLDLATLPPRMMPAGTWDDYMDRRIEEWIDVESALSFSNPAMRYFAAWLRENKPVEVPLMLVHGDLNPNNVMVDDVGRYSMIDWELAHVGDPREDLGWFELLGVNQPPYMIASDPDRFYERYRAAMGLTAEQINPAAIAYFTVLGTGTVYLQVVQSVDRLARGAERSINVGYGTCAVAGMNNVLFGAIDKHDLLAKGLA